MTKTEAIKLLGGSVGAAAREIGVTPGAISLWPEDLPPRLADRVQAALWRREQREDGEEEAPQPIASASQESEPSQSFE